MEISIRYQLISTLLSVGIGIVIGMIYDIFKFFRILSGLEFSSRIQDKVESLKLPIIKNIKMKKGKFSDIKEKILYFIWDLLFFIAITPVMQIFIHVSSSGIVRWYIIIGALLGYIIYYFTISKVISVIYEYILLAIKIILTYIMFFVKLPLEKFRSILINELKKLTNERKIKKATRKKIKMENKRNIIYISGKRK